jgi:hypothetical protein
MRCLNAICEEGHARNRQVAASYYYGEISERGAGPVLKEMALIAMSLTSLNPGAEEVGSDSEMVYALRGESRLRSLFDLEVAAVSRMIRGRRKSAGLVHDEWTEWLNDLEANGATVDELDDAFVHVEALDQYDEGGAIVRMSAHERTFACGRVDHEFTADDLPEHARFLASDLLRAYASGVEIEGMWDEVNARLDVLFPVKGKTAEGGGFFSRANLELQRLTRDALEGILEACFSDYHSTAMRNNRSYRRFYARIRRATDTRAIGELMKQAYEARQDGNLSVKHFIALNTAADNQRERLLSAPELPDQAIVNEYQPGQGIGAHVDCETYFQNTIVTVSLGSSCEMDFLSLESREIPSTLLEPGSALVLRDIGRYQWMHRIMARTSDHGIPRGRRVSLTYRNVILGS